MFANEKIVLKKCLRDYGRIQGEFVEFKNSFEIFYLFIYFLFLIIKKYNFTVV